METLREELKTKSFAELEEIKQKIGLKAFKEAMGISSIPKQNPIAKRENKNRPKEVSAKRRVAVLRNVVAVKKKIIRDPRFDELSGPFNRKFFRKTYSFLDDLRLNEKQELKKKLKEENDPEEREKIKFLIKRMTQQEKAQQELDVKDQLMKKVKEKEKDLVAEGKRPYHLKKSEKKKLFLVEKYKDLQKSGKLDKYLEKKRKRNGQKEKKKQFKTKAHL